jgi:hypothetical protein
MSAFDDRIVNFLSANEDDTYAPRLRPEASSAASCTVPAAGPRGPAFSDSHEQLGAVAPDDGAIAPAPRGFLAKLTSMVARVRGALATLAAAVNDIFVPSSDDVVAAGFDRGSERHGNGGAQAAPEGADVWISDAPEDVRDICASRPASMGAPGAPRRVGHHVAPPYYQSVADATDAQLITVNKQLTLERDELRRRLECANTEIQSQQVRLREVHRLLQEFLGAHRGRSSAGRADALVVAAVQAPTAVTGRSTSSSTHVLQELRSEPVECVLLDPPASDRSWGSPTPPRPSGNAFAAPMISQRV